MDATDRNQRIAVCMFWLIALLAAAYVAPRFVGVLLMLFSVLVFVLAVVGLVWPSLMKLPNRLAAVWIFALSVGLFVGGGVLMSPENGEGTAMDSPQLTAQDSMPTPETPEAREARIARIMIETEAERDRGLTEPQRRDWRIATDPCGLTTDNMRGWPQEDVDRTWRACQYREQQVAEIQANRQVVEPEPTATGGGLLERLIDVEARAACNVRLSGAARGLFSQGARYRWTETGLKERFPLKRTKDDPDVIGYAGSAIEFLDDDGTWMQAVYECDWNHETGLIVDVRTGEIP